MRNGGHIENAAAQITLTSRAIRSTNLPEVIHPALNVISCL